jgi:uncharacterized protein YaaQ
MAKLNLQEALAMYPPDARPIQILDDDAYRAAELRIEAGYVCAEGVRLMIGHNLETMKGVRRLLANAIANRNGEFALVRMQDVMALLQIAQRNWGPEARLQ